MAYFLAKTDPDTYSIEQLKQDGSTTWDGVTNAQAVAVIRTMKPGDRVFIYHSGGESRILGLAKITSAPRPDPANPKSAVVDLQYTGAIEPPVTLPEIKATGLFDDWALIRQGRLSTMTVPQTFVDWMKKRYPKAKL